MKASVLQENLAKALATVSRATPARSTLPICTHVLLQTEESRLRLTATDLEMAISCWVGAKVDGEGAIAVPARLLRDMVTGFPPSRLDLEVVAGPNKDRPILKVVSLEGGSSQLIGQDAEEFPPTPTLAGGTVIKVEAWRLKEAIRRVVFATSTERARPALTGVSAHLQDSILTLAAADGFRLAIQTLSVNTPAEDRWEIIIPAHTLSELARLLKDPADIVQMETNESKTHILFYSRRAEIISTLLQGMTFPNYRQLVPGSYTTRVVADVKALFQAVQAVTPIAKDGSGIVRVYATLGGGDLSSTLRLTAHSEGMGDSERTIDALVEGTEAHIALSSRYLVDVLRVMGKGQVALTFTSISSPGTLRLVGDDTYTHVVMPMYVQW